MAVQNRTDIARNAAGSTRREVRTLPTALSPLGSSHIEVHDVPNSLFIRLYPSAKAAMVLTHGPSNAPLIPLGGLSTGEAAVGPPEELGSRTIEGYTTTGSRQVFVVTAGTRGPNEVRVTRDIWYSPDLEVPLLIEKSDTLGNSTEIALKQITPGEPEPSLFTIPNDYTQTRMDTPVNRTTANVNATASMSQAPLAGAQSRAETRLTLSDLYRHFFLYEAHLEHVAETHPDVPRGGAIKDRMRKRIGLSEAEWEQVSAASLRMETAVHLLQLESNALIEDDLRVCKSDPQLCSSASPNSTKLSGLQKQRDQAIKVEFAALEDALGPVSAARLRAYLHRDIASHVQVVALSPSAPAVANQDNSEVSK